MTSPAPIIPGLTFERFLGEGGYADVYLYQSAALKRSVAVKVLRDSRLSPAALSRFTSEANAMARLEHPSIVPVYSTGFTADGRPYIEMMYYSRGSFEDRCARDKLSVPEVLRVGIQICSAVETAHSAGLLHRDIKPANILINHYGRAGLADFGIAAEAAHEDDDDLGVSVPWSPPETLYATAPASVRSDVYALGATLWHLLVGRSPFVAVEVGGDNSQFAIMRRVKDTPAPSTGRADVPTSLDRLLRQAMSKDPVQRPPSALAFARALQGIEQELRLTRTDIDVAQEMTPPPAQAIEPASGPPGQATRVRAQSVSQPMLGKQAFPIAGSGATVVPQRSAPSSQEDHTQHRHFVPGEIRVDEPRTVLRSAAVAPIDAPDSKHGSAGPSHRGRYAAAAASLLVAAVALAVFLLRPGAGSPTTQPAPTGSRSGVLGDSLPPGPIAVVGTRTDPNSATFTWDYSAALSSDSFVWHVVGDDGTPRKSSTNKVTVPAPSGRQTCVEVKVYRANGDYAPRAWSQPGCVR